MIEVSIEVHALGAWQVVKAEVTKLALDDYVVLWSDPAQVESFAFPAAQLAHLLRRCEEEYRWLEWEREASGIAGLLDDTEPMLSAARDNRECA